MKTRFSLPQSEIPKKWYNAIPDLPEPLDPPLDPQTLKPVSAEIMETIFPPQLLEQEFSSQNWFDIPDEVLKAYGLYRPTPLVRAKALEEALGLKARIYYKNESVSPAGSHKPNSAIAQAYYSKLADKKRMTTETGAGQWGTALAFACAMFGMKCTVYMVKSSHAQKPYRAMLMRAYGADVHPSPSLLTESGRRMLAIDPNCGGSLGMATSEAMEDASQHADTNYSLGSVLNHVLLHQTVAGLEVQKQLEMAGEKPDYLVGCVGGGSNFGGLILPFLPRKLNGEKITFVAVEPKACPTMTRGRFCYDYSDVAKLTPVLKMHTLGHSFMPEPIHAGGLRYHGNSPILSSLLNKGLIDPRSYYQKECFDAAIHFLKSEGFLPAPETSHAIRAAIDLAKENPDACIVLLYSGHGFLDLSAYDAYLRNDLQDFEYPEEKILAALEDCPNF